MSAMLRGYANGGAQASGSYIGALGEVLSHYPRMIALRAGDLVTGVPRETRFLPTPADVIAWCERELAEWRTIVARDDHERAIREEMKLRAEKDAGLAAARAVRPTLKQMQDKHGPNWGLQEAAKEDLVVKAARLETIQRANQLSFERECKAAGIDPAGGVSPSLVKILSDAETTEMRMRKAKELGRRIDRTAARLAAE